jgi:phosphoglycerate dehydrogenase-like enzyme
MAPSLKARTNMPLPKIAILDDTQNIAMASAEWSKLAGLAEIRVHHDAFPSPEHTIAALQEATIVVPMRERTVFSAALLQALPNLRMIALTGGRAPTLDVAACTAHGILVCNTGGVHSTASTAELAFGLILDCARGLAAADHSMRQGRWHEHLSMGFSLDGKTLGIVGLGRLGSRVAAYGQAFGMKTLAWSQNLTTESATAAGCTLVDKETLFRQSDVVSLHLVLSERTRGIVAEREISMMKPGAVLVNTSRGPLVQEKPLLDALSQGRIRAGIDVYDQEPLPGNHPLRRAPNTVLTPHLGYATRAVFAQFYGESVENIQAYLTGKPIRMLNPEALQPSG